MRNIELKFEPPAERTIEELSKLRHVSEYRSLWNSLEEKKSWLLQNPLCGTKIQHRLIPKEYAHLDNLWKLNLANHWRLLYTLKTQEVLIVAIVLDIVDHPTYDKKFGYKRR